MHVFESVSDLSSMAVFPADDQRLAMVTRRSEESRAAADIFIDMLNPYTGLPMTGLASVVAFLDGTYLPAERALVDILRLGADAQVEYGVWVNASHETAFRLTVLLDDIFASSQSYLVQSRTHSLRLLISWLVLSVLLTVAFVGALVLVLTLIVVPLDRARGWMLRLAEGSLEPEPPGKWMLRDVKAIFEALQVFRVNAVGRERLQQERLVLHAHIAGAHRELRADMEAAAVVQRSQLPPPAVIGRIRFNTYFRPSRFVAGDSYDFFALSPDRVGLFQVDVAGHGAAAGLVSVSSHSSVKGALHRLSLGETIPDVISGVNRNWNRHLTYFTVAAAELDPENGIGRMVQAGHPYPVLLQNDGTLTRLGDGGLPIGVLPEVEFEEITFPFMTGDRLFLFSDGIYEATNSRMQVFSEDSFINLLRIHSACTTNEMIEHIDRALTDWCGTDQMTDDVTLVVAEVLEADGFCRET